MTPSPKERTDCPSASPCSPGTRRPLGPPGRLPLQGEYCTVTSTFTPLQNLPGGRMHMVFNLAPLLSSPLHLGRDRYHFPPMLVENPIELPSRAPSEQFNPEKGVKLLLLDQDSSQMKHQSDSPCPRFFFVLPCYGLMAHHLANYRPKNFLAN